MSDRFLLWLSAPRFSRPENVEAVQELAQDWIND